MNPHDVNLFINDLLGALDEAMRRDKQYYHGLHANLSMMMQAEGVPKDRADARAGRFIVMAFKAPDPEESE